MRIRAAVGPGSGTGTGMMFKLLFGSNRAANVPLPGPYGSKNRIVPN